MKRKFLCLLLALTMVLSLAAAVSADEWEWEEEPNSTLWDAVEMKQRTEYYGSLYNVSDEGDLYRFTAQEDTYLTLHLSGQSENLTFVLLDSEGNVITEAIYAGKDIEGFDWYELQREIAAGTYYLGVFALDGENHGYRATLYMGVAFYDAGYHDYYASKPITPATCTTEGVSLFQCRCGHTTTDTVPADPEAHTWDVAITTAPTCTAFGLAHYTCTSCGAQKDEELYPEHTGRVDVVIEEPTVDKSGYGGFYCTDCGAEEYEHGIVPLNHHFIDVEPESFCDDPIKWAYSKNITSGTIAYHFSPSAACKRAHVVTFLWRAFGSPEPTSTSNPFTDVKESDFFYKAVLWAVENGITNGTTATMFSPDKECSRAQVVTFLWRAKGEPASDTVVAFPDVKAGQFYSTAVAWAVENGITNGMGDGTFGVGKTCSRAQVVTFLYRTMA